MAQKVVDILSDEQLKSDLSDKAITLSEKFSDSVLAQEWTALISSFNNGRGA